MNNAISIHCNDNSVNKVHIDSLHTELESYIENSKLLQGIGNCTGLCAVVNANLDEYSNYYTLTNKVSWAFASSNIEVPANSFEIFKLYCINLSIHSEPSIKNVLILLLSADSSDYKPESTPHNQKGDANNNDNEEEQPQSYTAVKPKYSLDKVILSKDATLQINRSISLIRGRDRIFNEWGFSEIDPHTKTIVCFYGAPGTGKTMCAHAIANELGKSIIIASYASIESKWVGEGPKNLRRIFADAEEQDAILFFDEADSFLSKRVANAETGSDKHYNRMSNEMFQLLEEYNGVIIFATNLVADFDKAFKSRILSFVEFKQPDKPTRIRLIQSMIPKKMPLSPPLRNNELEHLAEISEGFSGRDIRKAILATLTEGVATNISVFSFKEFETGFNSVKNEMESVENSAHNEISGSIIADFIEQNTTNEAILNVVLKSACQGGLMNKEIRCMVINLAKILNIGEPDLSIDYKDKDITNDIKRIIEFGCSTEAMRYSCEMLAMTTVTDSIKEEYIHDLASMLSVDNPEIYHEYTILFGIINKCNHNK